MFDAIKHALLSVLNTILGAFADALQAAIDLLPDMPAMPAMPDEMTTALGWIAWVFPVGTVIDILTFFVAAWLLWQLVAALMRWLRLLNA